MEGERFREKELVSIVLWIWIGFPPTHALSSTYSTDQGKGDQYYHKMQINTFKNCNSNVYQQYSQRLA